MLKLYHTPLSANSRRVWVALLEKEIPFELVSLNMDGDQFQPEFLAMNPFHHIPVLVDDGFNVIESLAILDYLEAKYPTPALLPTDAKALATVRMVEMVTVNELLPAINPFANQMMGLDTDAQQLEQSKQKILTVLNFFESLLGDDRYFAGSASLTLAEIVAGTMVPLLPMLGVSLDNHPKLSAWCENLTQRPAWQKTQPTQEAIEAFKPRFKELMAARQNQS
ncbi:glutathione S-transferase family protein [Coleofasciculus sp. FACHB-T130]|uniref:glutathione S-transferase family protein n=1 Tax=Cyanophyceae TaxID=3028117 RepID=UPI001682BA56|nr:glutathione S-transferase family protein [Coleofasciculus sp. FACHB-T130]MBD1881156.1 glutathione S-transferase family protein [Coleofasciculus sp. FACHB-T130]